MKNRDTTIAPTDVPVQSSNPNVFTGEERKALVDEIVKEINKDSVKDDALAKLKKRNWGELISKFFQHPAVLLVIGFAISGYIGTRITTNWQHQEWEKQQRRGLDFRGFDQKHEIIDEITKSVGEINAAAIAVVSPLGQRVSDKQLIRDEAEQIKDWRKASNEWGVKSTILKLKIATRIKSLKAAEMFHRITDEERDIVVNVNLLQSKLAESNLINNADKEKKNKAGKRIDDILDNIRMTGENLKQLVEAIAEEAKKDVENNKL
jgi:hypothetical protein